MSVLFDISSKIILEGDSTESLNYVFNDLHTDVVAAYSFRRLSPDYYGALIRVRNKIQNGDDTEKDFYPNADGKIDIDELMSYLGDSQGFLFNFYNQAVNAKTYDNPTDSNGNAFAPNNQSQPRIVLNKAVNKKNGLISAPLPQPSPPNTTTDYLKVNTNLSNEITDDMFAYFVGAHDGTSSNNAMFSKSGEYEFIYTNPTNVRYSDSTGSVDLPLTTASSDLRIHSFSRNKTTNTIDLQVNEEEGSYSIPGAISATDSDLYIGARPSEDYQFIGDFQELVIFNSYKDSTDKDAILDGVKKYYNVY